MTELDGVIIECQNLADQASDVLPRQAPEVREALVALVNDIVRNQHALEALAEAAKGRPK